MCRLSCPARGRASFCLYACPNKSVHWPRSLDRGRQWLVGIRSIALPAVPKCTRMRSGTILQSTARRAKRRAMRNGTRRIASDVAPPYERDTIGVTHPNSAIHARRRKRRNGPRFHARIAGQLFAYASIGTVRRIAVSLAPPNERRNGMKSSAAIAAPPCALATIGQSLQNTAPGAKLDGTPLGSINLVRNVASHFVFGKIGSNLRVIALTAKQKRTPNGMQ